MEATDEGAITQALETLALYCERTRKRAERISIFTFKT